MKTWKKSLLTSSRSNGEPSSTVDCEVRIGDHRIVVAFANDTGPQRYLGKELESGRFKLRSPRDEGRALLTCLPGNVLEGSWTEKGENGSWRIELDDSH